MHRVTGITVNNSDGSEYEHSWSRAAMKQVNDAVEEMNKVHPDWTSMVVSVIRVRT